MRHDIILASACYVLLASCSGQNLKSQNVQGDQSKPNTTIVQPKENAAPASENILTDQASGGKEIAGSFLTQCEAFSNIEIGCSLYQRESNQMVKYEQAYTQKILLSRNGVVESIEPNVKPNARSSDFQKIYVFKSSEQLNFAKTKSLNTNFVSTETSGVGSVGFRTFITFQKPDEEIGQFKPLVKSSKNFVSNKFIVKPKLCSSTTSHFTAREIYLTVKVKSTNKSMVTLTVGTNAKEPKIYSCKVFDKEGYYCYEFAVAKLETLDKIRFDGAAISNGYLLAMESVDEYQNCNLPTSVWEALVPMSVGDFLAVDN